MVLYRSGMVNAIVWCAQMDLQTLMPLSCADEWDICMAKVYAAVHLDISMKLLKFQMLNAQEMK